jgi:hypothetical protein
MVWGFSYLRIFKKMHSISGKNCDGFSYVDNANVGQSANTVLDNKHMRTRSEFIELIGKRKFYIF